MPTPATAPGTPQKPTWLKLDAWAFIFLPVPGLAHPAAPSCAGLERGSSAAGGRGRSSTLIPPCHPAPDTFFYVSCLSLGPEPQTGHRTRGEIRLFSRYPKLPFHHLIALIMSYSNIKETLQKVFPSFASIPMSITGTPPTPPSSPSISPRDFPVFSNMRYRSFFENAARWQLSHLSFKSHWIIFSIFLYGNQKFWLFCVLDMASLADLQHPWA